MHCIPFTFSQCFMHLDVCLYVENYVLIGLDCVEPMMQFPLARHMFMHFSYICTLSFLLLVLCCDCVFLFLFLSLSDRLCMAPKCKSTPSRNPLRSGTSSSATPLHVRFRDEKAHKEFSENFFKRGVHSECHVVLSDFSDTALPDVIHNRGWESLCEIPVSCPIMIIHEFYSNMHCIDTSIPQFATLIRGTCIVVTPKLVSEILHVL